MRRIKLTKNKYALVDDIDYTWLNQYKWYASKSSSNYYAERAIYLGGGRKNCKLLKIKMHRFILGLQLGDKRQVDHINHNTLDNRRCNLRICTPQQNQFNSVHKGGTSKYKGVHWCNRQQKWVVRIGINGKRTYLGQSDSEQQAAKIYNKAAKKLYGKFAKLNSI